jgi:hypothetical protein
LGFWLCHSAGGSTPTPDSSTELDGSPLHANCFSPKVVLYSSVLEGGAAGQVLARDRAIKLVVLLAFKQPVLTPEWAFSWYCHNL